MIECEPSQLELGSKRTIADAACLMVAFAPANSALTSSRQSMLAAILASSLTSLANFLKASRSADVESRADCPALAGRTRRRFAHSGVDRKSSYGAGPPRTPDVTALSPARMLSPRFLLAPDRLTDDPGSVDAAGDRTTGVGVEDIPHRIDLNGEYCSDVACWISAFSLDSMVNGGWRVQRKRPTDQVRSV